MLNWALMSLAYSHFTDSIQIVVSTNNPVHLTMYHTFYKPDRHKNSIILRGLAVPWGAYFCFVSTVPLEQQEAGDTLIHTFLVYKWSFCQTRWFAFLGTVGGVDSPSISALFEHHHSGVPGLQTEEQLQGIHYSVTYGGGEWGQRLPITNRLVRTLSFKLEKTGNPTGILAFKIRRVSDGTLIIEKTLDPAIVVPLVADFVEATFTTPLIINEECRIMVTLYGNNVFNCVKVWGAITDVKPGEYTTFRKADGTYIDSPTRDFTYKYTYQQY